MSTPIRFAPSSERHHLPADALVVDVSSRGPEPFCQLSPFQPYGGIPVPGMPGTTSDSVEGVWQGLKVFDGRIAPQYFSGRGRKRNGVPEGHRLGERLLDLVAARRSIYLPTYRWMLEQRAQPAVIQGFLDRAQLDIPQYVHDLGNIGSVEDRSGPLAHASVLADWLNERLAQRAPRTLETILAEAAARPVTPEALLLLLAGMGRQLERHDSLRPEPMLSLQAVVHAARSVCLERMVGQEARGERMLGRMQGSLARLAAQAGNPDTPAVRVGRALLRLAQALNEAPASGSSDQMAAARELLRQAATADGRFAALLPVAWATG
jgi:hypothetical protein